MTDTAARTDVLRDAMHAAVTGDESLIEALDEGVEVEPTGRRLELRGVLVAEFEGDRIGSFRQYWNEVELIDGLGLLPG